MHYGDRFTDLDWSFAAAHMWRAHRVTPEQAYEAVTDEGRVVFAPDYNSRSGRSVRIVGFSGSADCILTVIAVEDDGVEYGVNGWPANARDQREYLRERK